MRHLDQAGSFPRRRDQFERGSRTAKVLGRRGGPSDRGQEEASGPPLVTVLSFRPRPHQAISGECEFRERRGRMRQGTRGIRARAVSPSCARTAFAAGRPCRKESVTATSVCETTLFPTRAETALLRDTGDRSWP
jgi:hypothetical protein